MRTHTHVHTHARTPFFVARVRFLAWQSSLLDDELGGTVRHSISWREEVSRETGEGGGGLGDGADAGTADGGSGGGGGGSSSGGGGGNGSGGGGGGSGSSSADGGVNGNDLGDGASTGDGEGGGSVNGALSTRALGRACDREPCHPTYRTRRRTHDEPFRVLTLDIKRASSVEAAMADYVRGEELSGDNAYALDSGGRAKRWALNCV
eukprot:6205665-Pleurochrysis_carterae.AAC.1